MIKLDVSHINKNLRLARNIRGFSARALAKAAGIDPATLASYEIGRHTPQPDKLILLSRALNVSLDWLMNAKLDPLKIDIESIKEKE